MAAGKISKEVLNSSLNAELSQFAEHLDKNASLTEKGHVQLSNTPAMDETKAITPRGVAVVVGEFYNSGFNSASARIATDLNAINISSRYYTYNTTLNKPPNTLHGLVETIINDTQAVQIFYETYLNDRIYFRRKSEGVWKPWVSVVTSSMTWIEATPQNGWQQHPTTNKLKFTKDDMGFVHLKGELADGSYVSGTVITTLPQGYRPVSPTTTTGIITHDMSIGTVVISEIGSVRIYNLARSGYLNISTSFYAGV